MGIQAVVPVAPLAKNKANKEATLMAVQASLHAGVNPGKLIIPTEGIKDKRLEYKGWEKYAFYDRVNGFDVHYMVNITNPNDKLYTDLKIIE